MAVSFPKTHMHFDPDATNSRCNVSSARERRLVQFQPEGGNLFLPGDEGFETHRDAKGIEAKKTAKSDRSRDREYRKRRASLGRKESDERKRENEAIRQISQQLERLMPTTAEVVGRVDTLTEERANEHVEKHLKAAVRAIQAYKRFRETGEPANEPVAAPESFRFLEEFYRSLDTPQKAPLIQKINSAMRDGGIQEYVAVDYKGEMEIIRK